MPLLGPNASLTIACRRVLTLCTGHATLFDGTVTLNLQRAVQDVADMHVTLFGRAHLTETNEDFDTFRQTFTLGETQLEAGSHTFAFSFRVPGSNAPTEKWLSQGSVEYAVEASIKGRGLFGVHVVETKEVYVVSLAKPFEELPEPIRLDIADNLQPVGLFRSMLFSPVPTVGSFVGTTVFFDKTTRAPGVEILKYGMAIRQRVQVPSSSGHVVDSQPAVFSLWSHNVRKPELSTANTTTGYRDVESEPDSSEGGSTWRALHTKGLDLPYHVETFRLRSHRELRPTTLPETKTPIRVSHDFVFEIYWHTEGSSQARRAEFAKPITLASCACTSGELTLPSYDAGDVIEAKPKGHLCRCAMSIQELANENRAWLDEHVKSLAYLQTHPFATDEIVRTDLPVKMDERSLSQIADS